MVKRTNKKDILTDVPESEPWEGPELLRQKQALAARQRTVAREKEKHLGPMAPQWSRLFKGFLEIVDFTFRNTCGVDSNFQLADCDLGSTSEQDIRRFYDLLLSLLATHFGCLRPVDHEPCWAQLLALSHDPKFCLEMSEELKSCMEHPGQFAPNLAGKKIWPRVQELLHVRPGAKAATAGIYYQTALGQNLLYLIEQGVQEGWLHAD